MSKLKLAILQDYGPLKPSENGPKDDFYFALLTMKLIKLDSEVPLLVFFKFRIVKS